MWASGRLPPPNGGQEDPPHLHLAPKLASFLFFLAGMGQFITNERAIIMIAHIHALAISAAAAFGPQVLGDSLTLLDGEADEEPYGLFPPLMGQGGLTPAAEMWNGRIAMLGLIFLVLTSALSGKDIIEVVDIGLGGFLMK